MVLASETGVLEIAPDNIERKGRLEPGRMFLVDTEKGRIVEDEEIKDEICRKKAYGKWIKENKISLDDIEASLAALKEAGVPLIDETPRPGLTGSIAFLHPTALHGVLVELLHGPSAFRVPG